MQQTLTKNLIFFISGCFVLTLIQPNLQGDLALYGIAVNDGQYYRLLTVALVHGGWVHLICNMLALFSIGTPIENFYGKNKYVFILLTSLITGSLASYLFNPLNTYAVGASGMIFGLFGALAVTGKRMGANLKEASTLIAVNLAIPFLIPGIDWKAHLGGLIGGSLAALAIKPKKRVWE
ncbi:MAG: rhomboid family intramembrane serine protease [Actinomycetes bacterium]